MTGQSSIPSGPLTGKGDVLLNGSQIAQVLYSITTRQNMINAGGQLLPGQPTIAGQLKIISGERDLVKYDEMVLVLDDGRRARFIPVQGSMPPGTTQIHVNAIE